MDPERVEEMVLEYRAYNIENHDLMVKEFAGVIETLKF